MQRLKFLEDSFENLSFRVKSELYIFPLILIFLIGFILKDEFKSFQTDTNSKIELNSIKMKTSFLEILKEIENYANENRINLLGIKNSEGRIELELKESLKKQLEFINYLENYNNFSKIESFTLNEDILNIKISFDKFYKKNAISLKDKLKLFDTKNLSNKFILNAIVGNSVYINNKWLSLNGKIGSYTLKSISLNSVELFDGISSFTVEMYNE